MLSKKQQESLYQDILRVYDLSEEIIDVLESEGEKDVEVKTQLVQPFVEQVGESVDILVENYILYIQNKQKSAPEQTKQVESALRLVYHEIRNFIDKLEELPAVSKEAVDKVRGIGDKILDSNVLPEVGEEAGQLIHGKIYHTLQGLIKKLPHYERLIKAVRNVGIHMWRIIYYFARMKDSLIKDPANVVWGRKISDMKQQVLMEKQKAVEARERDLNSKTESHQDLINRSREVGMLFE